MSHECPHIESVIADREKYDLSVMLINEVERDSSVNDLVNLPLGWRAWRENVVAGWRRDAQISEEQS